MEYNHIPSDLPQHPQPQGLVRPMHAFTREGHLVLQEHPGSVRCEVRRAQLTIADEKHDHLPGDFPRREKIPEAMRFCVLSE